ncbi:hypothetical protein PISL3812_06646 [Talaromyces islandicus]|uniref:4-hydroxybenzoate polyprenyltransferase, mitochondrial n=1 Tax=Talaromyces islandicus TaxID=28573 RepID=A0A0U1M202_TALIS|nr:hypothetical protein PISL3812_06646 [Talaromyces islandicus]
MATENPSLTPYHDSKSSSRKDAEGELELPAYQPPTKGFLSKLPVSCVPYAQLMRLDRPAGFYAFYMPYVIGIAYAAAASEIRLPVSLLLNRASIYIVGCVFLRGAACTWNDNIDQDFDRQVARCRLRPIARGAVSTLQGHIFTAAQTLVGGLLLLALPVECVFDAVPIALLFALYPFGKRFTYYPQLILGFPFAGAIIMASHSLYTNPFSSHNIIPTFCLVFANICWTMVYDTIYAHQDIEDDVKAGVKGMAVRFKDTTHLICSLLSVCVVGLMITTGILSQLGPAYFILSSGGTAASLGSMIVLVDLKTPSSCAWWFHWGFWFVGLSMLSGLLAEYAGRF